MILDHLCTGKTSHILLHPGRTGILHFVGNVAVDIQCERRRDVPQIPLHSHHIVPVLERQNRVGKRFREKMRTIM